jgi:hypothetical protein
MRVIISGDREVVSTDLVEEAVKKSGFNITVVIQGGARGVDKSAKDWARIKGITCEEFPADWKNITRTGARVLTRKNQWTGKDEKYDADAGHFRNEQMAMCADPLIALQPNGKTPGTQSMIKLGQQYNLKVYVYGKDDRPEESFKYKF